MKRMKERAKLDEGATTSEETLHAETSRQGKIETAKTDSGNDKLTTQVYGF